MLPRGGFFFVYILFIMQLCVFFLPEQNIDTIGLLFSHEFKICILHNRLDFLYWGAICYFFLSENHGIYVSYSHFTSLFLFEYFKFIFRFRLWWRLKLLSNVEFDIFIVYVSLITYYTFYFNLLPAQWSINS